MARFQYTEARGRIGDILRACREEESLSQKELSELCGTSQANLSYLENGKLNFHYDTLAKIFDALGYDVEINFYARDETQPTEQSEWDLALADAIESVL